MSDEYRPITGLYRKYYSNQPLANAVITIRLLTNSFTLQAGYPTTKTPLNANDSGVVFQTDASGNLPAGVELFCSAGSIGGATKYRVTEPDGFEWDFILNYGDGSPVSMQTLRAGGSVPDDTATTLQLIEQQIINLRKVRYRTLSVSGSLLSDDLDKIVQVISLNPVNIDVQSTAILGEGFVCGILQTGIGGLTLSPADGVMLNGETSPLIINAQYQGVTIFQATDDSNNFIPNSYIVIGALA